MAAAKRTSSLLKKYGLFLCIPLFLAIAWFYADSTYPQYKVSAKIALKGVSTESAISGLKSKGLIKKAIDQLPLQVKFYNTNSPKKELYGDSLPVKFVFGGLDSVNTETSLELAISGDDQFTLTNNDTVSYHKFNDLVNESYGKFTVIKTPFFKSRDQTLTVKLNESAQVLNQFYNSVRVEPDSRDNVITVSTLAGTSQKGVDFLNALLEVYATANPGKAGAPSNPPVIYNTRQITENIDVLKAKAATLDREISKLKEENQGHKSMPRANARVDETQRKIYEAIRPYMKKPINQFVQVPYVDEIENPDLNDEVNEYNETELSKQRLLASAPGGNALIDSANKKLMMLQSDIFEKISGSAVSRNSYTTSSSDNASNVRIRIKEDSLNHLNKKIQAETHKYAAIKATSVKPNTTASSPPLVMIEKPEDNIEYIPTNELMIYGMALLAAAIILFGWWIIRISGKKIISHAQFDPGKLSEKINNLFAEKQID
jgi:hypothetical protein